MQLNNPFGVLEFLHWNHPWNNYKYSTTKDIEKAVKLMCQMRAGWVRMDFLWEDIELKKGKFEFAKYDDIVDIVTGNDISILGILNYTAPWANVSALWNKPPDDYNFFVDYALKVASRYKEKIKHWEVWNEPDSSVYWQPQDDLRSYCLLLEKVYLALKKLDPKCYVLNGGLANSDLSVAKLYKNKAGNYFDILNLHIFDSPLYPGALERVLCCLEGARKIMCENNDSLKKIWLTEIGCPGIKGGIKVKDWWLGQNSSEEEQAGWVKEVYQNLLKAPLVEKIFWAFLRDCKGHWDDGVDYLGLLRWDFSAKPAFEAYKECAEGVLLRSKTFNNR